MRRGAIARVFKSERRRFKACNLNSLMSSFGGGAVAAHASTAAPLGKRIQVVARVRKELTGETIDSDLNVSGNGCKITLIPPAKSKSDRRTEFLFDDVFVPDCRPEDLYAPPRCDRARLPLLFFIFFCSKLFCF